MNKTNEYRYLEVDYLPFSDEISTPYRWDKKSRTFTLKNEVILEQKYNPDLPDDQDYDAQYTGKYIDQDGNEVLAKYQDLTKAINKNRKFVRFSTNP